MIKRTTFLILMIHQAFCLTSVGQAEDVVKSSCVPEAFKFDLPKVKKEFFPEHEVFRYVIKYEFVAAGQATLEVHPGPQINCRPTYEFRSSAKSSKFIDNFFKVRDFNSSTVDRESLMSFGFHQNLREGAYRVVRNTTLDYVNGVFRYEKEYKGKVTKREGPLTQTASDILSAFFFVRTLPLKLGEEYYLDVFSDPDVYRLKVKVFPQKETVKVEAGKFKCFKVQPFVIGDSIFKAKDGQMFIWLTADDRHMPVMIRSKVSVGAFDAELIEFDTPKTDMVNEKVPT